MVRMKRITNLYRVLLLVVVLGACSGCGTCSSQEEYWRGRGSLGPPTGVWVYGGTVTDIRLLPSFFTGRPTLFGLQLFIPLILDTPLSFAADTILLPMTITQQIVGRPGEQDEETDPTETPNQ